jgi:hypothetical protein
MEEHITTIIKETKIVIYLGIMDEYQLEASVSM